MAREPGPPQWRGLAGSVFDIEQVGVNSSLIQDLKSPSILVRCAARVKARLAGKSIPSAGADAYVVPPVAHAVAEQPSAGGNPTPLVESVRALIEQKPEALAAVAGVLRPGAAVPVLAVAPAAVAAPIAPAAVAAPITPAVVAKAAAPSEWDRCVALLEDEACPRERGRLGAHMLKIDLGEPVKAYRSREQRDADIARLNEQIEKERDPQTICLIARHMERVEAGEASGLWVPPGQSVEFLRVTALLDSEACPKERFRMAMHLNALEAGEDVPPFQTRAEKDAAIEQLQARIAATADPAERHALASKVLELW